jgi:hypothetical protein
VIAGNEKRLFSEQTQCDHVVFRTRFLRVIAHGDHVIELLVLEFFDGLEPVAVTPLTTCDAACAGYRISGHHERSGSDGVGQNPGGNPLARHLQYILEGQNRHVGLV